jgi:hypothetical protein
MLSAEATGLVIRGAKGLIKLTRRVDLILAEKTAVEGPLGISPPILARPPTKNQARSALRKLLSADHDPPLPDADRAEIEAALEGEIEELRRLMGRWCPEQAMGKALDLDGAFVAALRARHPDLVEDRDLLMAAFYVSAEVDVREANYTWRIALSVTDVLLDFGAENAALFTRDEGLQQLVASVLKRFGEADLHTTPSSHALLRSALGTTLNAALDVRGSYAPDDRWVNGILDALVRAREAVPEAERDEFLVGLLEGRGYPGLVAASLQMAAGRIEDGGAESFRNVAGDVLLKVAEIAQEQTGLRRFFEDHWGDILRAGLTSVEVHGPGLFAGQDPLLAKVLIAVAGELARNDDIKALGPDAVDGVARAAIAAVAANPDLVEDLVAEEWLQELIASVTSIVADTGLKASFSQEGLEGLVRSTLQRFAERPELIVEHPGLARELLRGVLGKVSGAVGLGGEELATAAVSGALAAVSDHPGLIDLKYPQLVAGLAGQVAALVEARGLTRVQGKEIVTVVTVALAENPTLFLELERKLAEGVIQGIVDVAAETQTGLIAGAALVHTVREVLTSLGRSGQAALKNHPQAEIVAELTALVSAGLVRAEKELGNRLDRPAVPAVIGALVVAWARGEIATIDPGNDNFRRLFSELAERAAA